MAVSSQTLMGLVLVYCAACLSSEKQLVDCSVLFLNYTEVKKWGWRNTGSYKPFSLRVPVMKHSLHNLGNGNYLVLVFFLSKS